MPEGLALGKMKQVEVALEDK
ncbi:hypothetical protein [Sporomusa acidovorans]